MKIYYFICILFINLSVYAEGISIEALDKKIIKYLTIRQPSAIEKSLIQLQWNNYKELHNNYKSNINIKKGFFDDETPTIKKYSEYVGHYIGNTGNRKINLEVVFDKSFFVRLENKLIPAINYQGVILFTTGDVLDSSLLVLQEKNILTLELYVIMKVEEKYFFFLVDAKKEKWLNIGKK